MTARTVTDDRAVDAPARLPFGGGAGQRRTELSVAEREALGTVVDWTRAGRKGWPPGAKAMLAVLLSPLYDVLDHMGAVNTVKRCYTIRTTVICLLIRAMHRHQCTFWAFSSDQWCELLGRDYASYIDRHGVTANARHQLIGVAYLLGNFDQLDRLGKLSYPALATKLLGESVFEQTVSDLLTDLRSWGYTKQGNTTALRASLAQALLSQRSFRLSDLDPVVMERLYQTAPAKITRRGLVLLSYILVRRGQFAHPLGRDGQLVNKERIVHRRAIEGVPPGWLHWCDRWYTTSTLQRPSRISVLYRLLQVGRWLAQAYPHVEGPADWTLDISAAFMAAVDRAQIGQWSVPVASVARRTGQPISARGKEGFYRCVRTFFADCQEWGWISRRFNPARSLRTPGSVRALIGPDPRVIEEATWAKLVWAGLNLTDSDLGGAVDGRDHRHLYPTPMLQALAVVWLFSGLRRDEIMRLPVGCTRQEVSPSPDQAGTAASVCLLDVPVNKTNTAFTKPVDALVGRLVQAWERQRPPQPAWPDRKTGQAVHFLFCYRGRPLGLTYLNRVLIPLLCQKAGVPPEDARGRITSHRARATIATQLYNAKEPFSLLDLQAWLGHSSPESTRHYAKVSPTKLAQSYKNAGYFARNLRAVEVLIDQEAVQSGAAAAGEPWRYYDLGHGYCTYDFFDQCKHRMACAKCSFYRPKVSTAGQLVEGKKNLLRLLQEIPLLDDERAAVEDGLQAMDQLLARLAGVPTPDQ
jgi:integrase